jgi:hypothetical protein
VRVSSLSQPVTGCTGLTAKSIVQPNRVGPCPFETYAFSQVVFTMASFDVITDKWNYYGKAASRRRDLSGVRSECR